MRAFVALLAVAATATPLAAQRARGAAPLPIELGVDAALAYDERIDGTEFEFPAGRVRAGFFLTPALSLEPTLGVQRLSSDGASVTNLDGALGLLAHLTGRPVGRARTASLFVRPFVGFTRTSFNADDDGFGDDVTVSRTQANVGVGLGVKLPVLDRLAWRLEGAYTRRLETDDLGATNRFALNVGLSFHTR